MKSEAGKLKNLNDLVVGAVVMCVNGKYGNVTNISDIEHNISDEIVCIKATISYPNAGMSFFSYRRDGRTTIDPEYDIVKLVRPENFKVKGVRVFSDRALTQQEIKSANNAIEMLKISAELGAKNINRKIFTVEKIKVKAFLSSKFNLSVKVL